MATAHVPGAKFQCYNNWLLDAGSENPECDMFFDSNNETFLGETFYWCESTASIQASTTGSVLYTKSNIIHF